jgi:hypothetical protein
VPITVAARYKAWTVFVRSNTVIVCSNPTQGTDVYVRLFCVCVVLCVGIGLATGWSLIQGVLTTVYRITKLKKRPGPNKRLLSHWWMNESVFLCWLLWSNCEYAKRILLTFTSATNLCRSWPALWGFVTVNFSVVALLAPLQPRPHRQPRESATTLHLAPTL